MSAMQILHLLWLANLLGCVICIVLAAAALLSIAHSCLRQALLLIVPAFVFSILTNIFLAFYWFATRPLLKNDDAIAMAAARHEYLKDWIYIVIVPLVLSLFVAFLVRFHRDTPRKVPYLVGFVNIGFTLTF